MQIRIGKRRKIQFTDKKHPLQGILSALLAALSFAMMIILFVCSGMEKGNGGIMYGYPRLDRSLTGSLSSSI